MPKRKQSRKGKSGRSFSKRRKFTPYGYGPVGGTRPGRRGTTQSIIRAPIFTTDRTFVPLTVGYVGAFTTGASGALSTLNFKLNSAFNPLGATSALKAPGFANWCGNASPSMYRAYIVHAVRVQFNLTAQANNMFCAIVPRYTSAAPPPTIGSACGLARAFTSEITAYNTLKYSKFWTIGEIYGQSPQTVAIADSFAALYNADPASSVSLDFLLVDPAGASTLTCTGSIRITQYCEFFGRDLAT